MLIALRLFDLSQLGFVNYFCYFLKSPLFLLNLCCLCGKNVDKIKKGYTMAFIRSRIRNGKKSFYIVWHDASTGRCEVSCKKFGAANGEMRKKLLKFYQDKENQIAFEVENKLFRTAPIDSKISELAKKYLDKMQARLTLRTDVKGKAGISKSHYNWTENVTQFFLKYLTKHKIFTASQLRVNILNDYRSFLELKQDSLAVSTVNLYLRYTKMFLNNFRFTDPPLFENVDMLCSVLKNFPSSQIMPFHFEIVQLSEILTLAREFDAELCKITRESKNAGKMFNGTMPAKNVPILPMILLVMLTGMRKSDALALKWSNVNLETGLIKYQAIKNNKICIVPLVSDPNGDISADFLLILKKWRAERPQDIYVLPHPLSEKPTEIKHTLKRFRSKLSQETGKNFTWQNLRKNFESYAVSFGIPPAITAFWVGHSPAVAEKHYMSYAIGKLNAKNIASAMGITKLLDS